MTRSDIVRAIAIKTNLTQTQAREAVDAFVDTIRLAANENDDVTIAGFGKFTVRDRKEAVRVNPGTRETVTVGPRKTITFRASKAFRSTI